MTVDLRTRYLGLGLSNPLVPSASPLSYHMDTLLRLEAEGAAAVVLQSLFEEQIEQESMDLHRLLELWSRGLPETPGYFPELDDYNKGPSAYLEFLESAKDTLTIPVIASLNGSTPGGWVRYAERMEQAGADAIELNVYFVASDPNVTSADIEARHVDIVTSVSEAVSVPVAVKLGPFFSSIPDMARRLVEAGADGLVLFNRFLQPDIDLENMKVVPALHLSTSRELLLPLRWIAILRGRIEASLAATTGIHASEDVVKVLLAGADVAMMASVLLRNGPEHLATVLGGLRRWLDEHGYESVEQLKGALSQESCPTPEAFERANYMKALVSYAGPDG